MRSRSRLVKPDALVHYFERPGRSNTAKTLELARKRAEQIGIRDIVVASYTGYTGLKAAKIFKGFNLVVVGGVYGFEKPNKVAMSEARRSQIEKQGGKVLFGGHAFGMIGRAIRRQFGTVQSDELIANVLRLFGQGVKVACEITCMATDAGMIKSGSEVIAIAGTENGADTAIVLTAANTHRFFDTRIHEIICKPRLP